MVCFFLFFFFFFFFFFVVVVIVVFCVCVCVFFCFFFVFFFRSVELTFFVNSFISCGMASSHIIDASEFAIRKVSFNQNKGRLSVTNLRSPGPEAGQPISVKVKCRIPFSEPIQRSVRGDIGHFKTKWRPKIQFSCILSRNSL